MSPDVKELAREKLVSGRFPSELRSDFLKVGHHGSRTSSSPLLLGVVRPGVAAISCGARNRFRHPHPETLEILGRSAIHILRTDLAGGVAWRTDGTRASLSASD